MTFISLAILTYKRNDGPLAADIGLTALSITLARARLIDFTRAYYVETTAILLPIPEEVQNYLAVFAPFSLGAWCLLLATVVVLVVLVAFMTQLEERVHSKRPALNQVSVSHQQRDKKLQQNLKLDKRLFSLEQLYYAINCVLAILLLRGKFIH